MKKIIIDHCEKIRVIKMTTTLKEALETEFGEDTIGFVSTKTKYGDSFLTEHQVSPDDSIEVKTQYKITPEVALETICDDLGIDWMGGENE